MRLSLRDANRVRAVRDRLRGFALGDVSAHAWLSDALSDLCDGSPVVTFQTALEGERVQLSSLRFVAGSRRTATLFAAWIHKHGRRWGGFDPIYPERGQRNRVVVTLAPSRMLETGRFPPSSDPRRTAAALHETCEALFRPMNWDLPQVRLLSCDGPRLLSYVGLGQPDGIQPRHRRMLASLAPDIRARCLIERRLDENELATRALEATLDHLPSAAFVLDARHRIAFANQAGRAWLESASDDERASLRSRRGPDDRTFAVTQLVGPTRAYLAIRHVGAASAATASRITCAVRRYGLTPREAEVLTWLVRGVTNQRIAAELGCAEATVEIHVSRILAKTDCGSRGAVVAAVLSPS